MAQAIDFKTSAVAITGAAGGIGRALALAFAERGSDVAIADVNEPGLLSVAEEISNGFKRQVLTQRVDVADSTAMAGFAAAAVEKFPHLNMLINNAGVALLGDFDEIDDAQIQWLMGINFWGVVHGTRAFMPHLSRQPVAHIANVSSVIGIIAPPGQCAYSAAKFAVRGFSEALRHELKRSASRVRLSVIHPGGIDTDIARSARHGSALREKLSVDAVGARFKAAARTTPQQAAARIIRGIERNEPRILIGGDAKILDLLQRLRPASYWSLMQRALERLMRDKSTAGAPLANSEKS
jgi:NAD(P)-dependent dehydrogenase (short-subunit alcohol dehydrogenase family)